MNASFNLNEKRIFALLQNTIGANTFIYKNCFTLAGEPYSLINQWRNKNVILYTGYSIHEIKTMGYHFFEEVLHADDLQVVNEIFEQAKLQPAGMNYETLIRFRPKGKKQYLWLKGIGMVTDKYPDGSPRSTWNINTFFCDNELIKPKLSFWVQDCCMKIHHEQLELISVREREVLALIVEGKTDKQIADILFISVKTVATHRNNMLRKLRLHNTAQLSAFAVESGLVRLHLFK